MTTLTETIFQGHTKIALFCGIAGNYIRRQTERWGKQYEASKTHDIPAMDQLIAWLLDNIPADDNTTVVHGDYRLDSSQPSVYFFS